MKEQPITMEQTLDEKDYVAAEAVLKYFSNPMSRRSVHAAMCLTGAVIAASLVHAFQSTFSSLVWIPILLFTVFSAAAVLVWFLQPKSEARCVRHWFRSCPLAALPTEIAIFHDRVTMESKCETITEYWTDFSICVETDDFIAAAGGRERFLFAVKKNELSEDTKKQLSALFYSAFEGRWYRLKRKGEK